jgi:hypothetical protein
LNIELNGFYKIVNGITASNQGFYNNFQYKMLGSYTAKGFWNKTAKRFSTWVSYTYSVNDYEFDSFTPLPSLITLTFGILPRFNYDILDNLKISVGIWRNGQPYTRPIEGNVRAVIILWLIMVRQIVKT